MIYTPTLKEKNTYSLTFNLVDENGAAIPHTSLDALTCTLYYYNQLLLHGDRYHMDIVNSRNNQNVLNTNNFTVNSSGVVVWNIQPNDTKKINQSTNLEIHVALVTWKWEANAKQASEEIHIPVEKVPFTL